MSRSEWGELENRLEVLLLHMLKWDYQPARRSRSWKATMREQRNAIRRLMRRSPSLQHGLETTIADVYRDAVGRASDETGLSARDFSGPAALRRGRGSGAGARGGAARTAFRPPEVGRTLAERVVGEAAPAGRAGPARRIGIAATAVDARETLHTWRPAPRSGRD